MVDMEIKPQVVLDDISRIACKKLTAASLRRFVERDLKRMNAPYRVEVELPKDFQVLYELETEADLRRYVAERTEDIESLRELCEEYDVPFTDEISYRETHLLKLVERWRFTSVLLSIATVAVWILH
jgi:hypothetical protein